MLEANSKLQNRWQHFSLILALLALSIAGLGLSGWFFNSYALRSGFGTDGTMKVNTGLCLFLASAALIGLRFRKLTFTRLMAIGILFISGLTLLEYAFNKDLGIDQLFFLDPDNPSNLVVPGRMALFTTIILSALALALLLVSYRKYIVAQLLTTVSFILGYASFLGHLFHISHFYAFGKYSTISGHTALALTFLNLGLLLHRSDVGWMKTFSSSFLGGKLARLSFTYFMLTVPVFMGVYLYGLEQWQFTPVFGIMSSFLVICFITIPIAYFFLNRLNNLDAALQQANQNLQQTNDNLAGRNLQLSQALDAVNAVNQELATLAQENKIKSLTLEKRNQELTSINQGLDDIVYMTGHDLKTPINNLQSIMKELRLITDNCLMPEDQQLITLADDSVIRLKRTIEDLTQVIRSQQMHTQAPEPVQLVPLLQEIQAELGRDILATKACIKSQFLTDKILFSRIHLRSILFNLLSNALKYRSPDRVPEVCIIAELVPEGVQMVIADNGLGLTENQQAKLFTIFKRFHSHVEGSGIGLYIVKRILENYGGRIRVSSEVGKGTTFTILIPQNF